MLWESSANNRLACAVLKPEPAALSSHSFGLVDCAICFGRDHAEIAVQIGFSLE
jgi:hypothetical protein